MPINDGLSYPVGLHKWNKSLKQFFSAHRLGCFAITKRGDRIWTSLFFTLEDGERYMVKIPVGVIHVYERFYIKNKGHYPHMPSYIKAKLHHSFKKVSGDNLHGVNVDYRYDDNDIDGVHMARRHNLLIDEKYDIIWGKFKILLKNRTNFKNVDEAILALVTQQVQKWEESSSA